MQDDPTTTEPAFPQRIWVEPNGRRSVEYVIPEALKAEVLNKHWLFVGGPPALDAICYDLHADLKPFRVGDFKLIREGDHFFCIVSPLGGSLIDWLTEEDLAPDDTEDDECEDEDEDETLLFSDPFDYTPRNR
jgi:hypothetical protein